MQIDRRITNGLAWAGVLLVVGIPTADLLSAQLLGDATPAPSVQVAAVAARIAPIPAPLSQRPVAKPDLQIAATTPVQPVVAAPPARPTAQVAAVTPAKPAVIAPPAATPATETAGVVNTWLNSGKPLPSYITDEPAVAQPTQVAATPPARAPIVTTSPAEAPVAIDPVQVASIGQPRTAPVPMPLSMRPLPVAVTTTVPVVVPVAVVAPGNDLIITTPGAGPRPIPPADITAQELEDWESGPLAEFLAQRQAQRQGSQADVTYDDDGFFLDQGPNGQPRRRDRVIGPANDFFFPFFD